LLNLALSDHANISSRYSSLTHPSLATNFPSSNLSQINDTKYAVITTDNIDPALATKFQPANASG
jgi:hypothetical protein